MILNHLGLSVGDVQSAVSYFERYFDFALQTSRTSPAIAILNGAGDVVLALHRRTDEAPYPDDFHIGFYVDSADAVHALHAKLTEAGESPGEVTHNRRGTMLYCRHQGVLIEVNCPTRINRT